MKDPLDENLVWSEETLGGFVTSASASIDLASPSTNPDLPAITIFLDVEESDDDAEEPEDHDAESPSAYAWRFSYCSTEDDDAWSEDGDEVGQAPGIEAAKKDCWRAVIDFLRSDGYSDEEIANSV